MALYQEYETKILIENGIDIRLTWEVLKAT